MEVSELLRLQKSDVFKLAECFYTRYENWHCPPRRGIITSTKKSFVCLDRLSIIKATSLFVLKPVIIDEGIFWINEIKKIAFQVSDMLYKRSLVFPDIIIDSVNMSTMKEGDLSWPFDQSYQKK